MVVSDPIADMLTRIRNSIMTRHESTDVPYSNVKFAVAKILKDEGYVKNYKVYIDEKRRKFIKVYISYDEYSQSVITGLERVSKPGRRVYVNSAGLSKGRRTRQGTVFLSTSSGLMTDRQALAKRVGGELLFRVW